MLGISCWQQLCTITVEKYFCCIWMYMCCRRSVLHKVLLATDAYLLLSEKMLLDCSAMEWNVSNAKNLDWFSLTVYLTDGGGNGVKAFTLRVSSCCCTALGRCQEVWRYFWLLLWLQLSQRDADLNSSCMKLKEDSSFFQRQQSKALGELDSFFNSLLAIENKWLGT